MSETRRAPAPDQSARDRIETDLQSTLFVEAGAGSGKTTALVTRVVALVVTGAAQLRNIAAITFTDKAAAELRDRVRQELERRVADGGEVELVDRCRAALEQLDSAAIGTLHSFAQRILSEHPVEAGLPPRVEVLDEVTSGVEFERRWTTFRDELLADPELERTLLLLLAAGVRETALRALADAFDDNWDLVDERVPETAPEPPSVLAAVEPALAAIDEACRARVDCVNSDNKLLVRLDAFADYAAHLRTLTDEVDLLEALDPYGDPKPPSHNVSRTGNKQDWRGNIDAVRGALQAAGERLASVRGSIAEACAQRLGVAIRRFTLEAAVERRAAGQLEFHDLLVMARALLRDPEHGSRVRAALARHYQRLLLDEFQDTDPIQIELAVRIAAAAPASTAAGAGEWADVAVESGRLFVVGDPKQSIYRFRRADISTFLEARDRFGPDGGGAVELTANFRTADPVIAWVNRTFATLMAEPPEIELHAPSQPQYVALDAVRPAPPEGPPVAVVGRAEHAKEWSADELRSAEAADVAASIARALAEGWSIGTEGGWRPPRLGDITVLVPARTSLPFLEDALDAAGIPFRAESSSLVYATRAVRDLLMVLRAIDDPTDHLRIVGALRTPLFACGDDDLFRFKRERRGKWDYRRSQPDTVPADDPVALGLTYLRRLHDSRQWHTPSELLDQVLRDRRALELGFAEGRPRDVWRRLRFVVDQARGWTEATGGGLRQYLHWVDQQTAEGARVAESVLPETDDDAVRIMTIHAAKGLEFPITIVSGLSTVPQSRWAPAEVAFPRDGGVGYRFGRYVTTQEFRDWKPIDEQMGFDERIRLLYVACTRARDHLVVSLHRKARSNAPERTKRTNAELLLDGMGDLIDGLPDAATGQTAATLTSLPERPAAPVPLAEWEAERSAALARGARPTTVAATALTDEGSPDAGAEPTAKPTAASTATAETDGEAAAEAEAGEPDPGLQKRPRDLDLPPWLKGRYGTAVGRAVHGVLQTVDLATGAGLDAAVAAQCEAEAIPDRAGDVRRLAADALTSPTIADAATRSHWREVYACTPVGDRLLEGYVDLLYRADDGLVVVDYKTAATSDPDELDRRVAGYRLQGAAYAHTLARSAGEPVIAVVFVFLTPDGAVERRLDDLDAAIATVQALVAAGEEVVVDQAAAI